MKKCKKCPGKPIAKFIPTIIEVVDRHREPFNSLHKYEEVIITIHLTGSGNTTGIKNSELCEKVWNSFD